MRLLALLPLILCFKIGITQEKIFVHTFSEILGDRSGNTRYYHPIEGGYDILLNNYSPDTKTKKRLGNFVYVDPKNKIHNDTIAIQANTFRHYVDTKDLIYVSWGIGADTVNNQAKLDSFAAKSKSERKNSYGDLVQRYFEPFWMGKYEVSNGQYRAFVNWVRDSLIREEILKNDNPNIEERLTNEELWQFLKTSKTEEKNGYPPNRSLYSLDYEFDYRKKIAPEKYIFHLSKFMLNPKMRFYNQKVPDVRKLNYSYLNRKGKPWDKKMEIVNIYPDTTCWLKINSLAGRSIWKNMYFWHPAFDNYPVVGLSYHQIMAFIDWKHKMWAKENPDLAERFYFDLPSVMDYEKLIHHHQYTNENEVVLDNSILTNLDIGSNSNQSPALTKIFISMWRDPLLEVFLPAHFSKGSKKKKVYRKNYGQSLLDTRVEQNIVGGEICFLSNNVSEMVKENYENNYEDLFDAYVNYNCVKDIDYCQYQRFIDLKENRKNDTNGVLVLGSNWFDERYNSILGINVGGIYPKRFVSEDSAHATVGFRLVLRERKFD